MAKPKAVSVTERPAEVGHVRDYGHGSIEGDTGGNRTIYVQSNALWSDMVTFAEAQGMSRSEVISRAILAYITSNAECPVCKRAREIYMVGSQPVKRAKKR